MRKYSEDKISVIIPCYNVERYIDRCLESVVNQTIGLDQLEIICVNDASTDRTWERLEDWEKKYSENILLVNCQENGRQGRARNIGLSYASGKYITFLDADDWMETDTYEKMYKAITGYDCDIVRCKMIRDSDKGDIWEKYQKRDGKDTLLEIYNDEERRKFIVSDVMDHLCCNKMYTREIIFDNQIRFPEGSLYEDIYWGMFFYLYAQKVYFLNERLYHYYINESSTVMRKEESYHMDRFRVILEVWEEYKSRGAMEKFQRELELNFLVHFYLNGIKMLAICYEQPEYQQFWEICATVQKTIPEYKSNPYISKVLDDMCQLQIALIDKNLTKEEFAQVVAMLREK